MIGKLVGSAGFLSSGGTIGGDLTISGDLTVTGSNTYTYDEQVDGQVWIKDSTASSATQGGHLRLFSDDGAVMASGHRLGVLEFAGAEDTSSTITVGARIEALCDDTWSATENGADMVFYTTDGNASESEVLRLTADNNVGIGQSSPDGKVHIESGSAGTVGTLSYADDLIIENSGAVGISLRSPDGNSGSIVWQSDTNDTVARIYGAYNSGNEQLAFETSGSERMKIDDNSRISLSNNDTGTSSTVFGYLAGMPGAAGAVGNIFIGQEAGENVGSHDTDGNTLIGYRAGRGTFTANTDHNTTIGYISLNTLTSGANNTALGSGAGAAVTEASNNVIIGRNAGATLSTSSSNVLIGHEAGLDISAGQTTTDGTICIGREAGSNITNGAGNTAIGHEALKTTTTGNHNTAIGHKAADVLVAGSDKNTAIGMHALGAGNNDTTHENTVMGYGSGDTITNGHSNTCLGSQANVSAGGAVGQIAVGQAVTCTADNTATLGIGSNTASLGLDGSDTSWAAASSDKRLKENIETSSAGLDVINDLRPVTYNWKKAKDVDNGMPQYKDSEEPVLGSEYGETLHGFIAQEVKEVVDNHSSLKEGFKMWKLKDDGTQTVADGNLIPILVKAVQELTAKVEALEKK